MSRETLGEMIQRVKSGERITLTHWGKTVAMIVPISKTDAHTADRLRPPDEAWKEIERTLEESEPEFKGWKEATTWVRDRRGSILMRRS